MSTETTPGPVTAHDDACAGAAIASTPTTTPAASHPRRHPLDRLSRRSRRITLSLGCRFIEEKIAQLLLSCQGGKPTARPSVIRSRSPAPGKPATATDSDPRHPPGARRATPLRTVLPRG